MLREANIPFLLWLPAALVFHLAGGGGAVEVSSVVSERSEIIALSRDIRRDVRDSLRTEVAIEMGDYDELGEETEPDEDADSEPDPDAPEDPDAEADPDDAAAVPPEPAMTPPKLAPQLPKDPKTPPVPPPKAPETEKEPEPEKKPEPEKQPEKKPEPPKVAEKEPEKKPEPEKQPEEKKEPAQRLELPKPDGRIAVINDPSIAKDQKDNPNASRIADEANTVDEETMARFRSYDQNTSKPTGGGEPHPSPLKEPGNADVDERGFSTEVESDGPSRSGSQGGPEQLPQKAIARSPGGNDNPKIGRLGEAAVKGLRGVAAGAGPESAETITGPGEAGGWSISPEPIGDGNPLRKGQAGRKGRAGVAAIPGVPMPGALPQMYSISAYGLQEALGETHLKEEEERARNTRLSKHRGSLKGNSFEKYKAAIENYDPTVKPGNQTSLNAARVPFASFINGMHNRIHPIFADSFLGGLKNLGPDDKLSNMKLVTHMEVVLDGATGAVVRAGIVKPSGVTAFDVGALSSIESAAPYGEAPAVIVSPDGKVYVHWEFYRDPYYACTSKFARPYLINPQAEEEEEAEEPGPRRPSKKQSEPTAKNESSKKKSDDDAPKKDKPKEKKD